MVSFGAGLMVSGQYHGNILLTQASQRTEIQSHREILCLQVLSHIAPPDWQLGRANLHILMQLISAWSRSLGGGCFLSRFEIISMQTRNHKGAGMGERQFPSVAAAAPVSQLFPMASCLQRALRRSGVST